MKLISAIGIMATVLLLPVSGSAASNKGEEIVSERLHETRYNRARNIGIMTGARAYCGYDPEPFLTNYRMYLATSFQAPQMDWDRMVNGANTMIETLQAASAPCTDDFKRYLEGLTY